MINPKIKKKAEGIFPQINAATEWIELPEPQAEIETSKGIFRVIAQHYGAFCGDYYSVYNICFVWTGDSKDIPAAKVSADG